MTYYIFINNSYSQVVESELFGITDRGKLGLGELWRAFWVKHSHNSYEEQMTRSDIEIREISKREYDYLEACLADTQNPEDYDICYYDTSYCEIFCYIYESSEEEVKNKKVAETVKEIVKDSELVETWPPEED